MESLHSQGLSIMKTYGCKFFRQHTTRIYFYLFLLVTNHTVVYIKGKKHIKKNYLQVKGDG